MTEHGEDLLGEYFRLSNIPAGEALTGPSYTAVVTAPRVGEESSAGTRRPRADRSARVIPPEARPKQAGGYSPPHSVIYVPEWSVNTNQGFMDGVVALDQIQHMHPPNDMTAMRGDEPVKKALKAAQSISGVCFLSFLCAFLLSPLPS